MKWREIFSVNKYMWLHSSANMKKKEKKIHSFFSTSMRLVNFRLSFVDHTESERNIFHFQSRVCKCERSENLRFSFSRRRLWERKRRQKHTFEYVAKFQHVAPSKANQLYTGNFLKHEKMRYNFSIDWEQWPRKVVNF